MMQSMNIPVSPQLPRKVEISVESLEGIVWSSNKKHKNRDEVESSVPFVTATVEFSGTCQNMKIHSASKYPHIKNPAVESYFAALDSNKMDSPGAENEIRTVKSIKTQEFDGKAIMTTTTTITSVQTEFPSAKLKDGEYPLVAKWENEASDEHGIIDSVDYATKPQLFGITRNNTDVSYYIQGKSIARPHLSLTLPATADHQSDQPLSMIKSMLSTCRHQDDLSTSSLSSIGGNKGKPKIKDGESVNTKSTASSSIKSALSNATMKSQLPVVGLVEENPAGDSYQRIIPVRELESLLDTDLDSNNEASSGLHLKEAETAITRQEEAYVEPVLATNASKERVAKALTSEISTAVFGRVETPASSIFGSLTWMLRSKPSPEIIEMKVRVMPEDVDELDDATPGSPFTRNLEGVAHLLFWDFIAEEGTTILDLPLKMNNENRAMTGDQTLSSKTATARNGEEEHIFLSPNAKLRIRVTIVPEVKQTIADHPKFTTSILGENGAMGLQSQSQPKDGLSGCATSSILYLQKQVLPLQDFFHKIHLPSFFQGKREGSHERRDGASDGNIGSFPRGFAIVVPDSNNNSMLADTFLRK